MHRACLSAGILGLLLSGCGSANGGDDPGDGGAWVTLAPLPAGPRQELPAVVLNGEIVAIGGFNASGATVATVEAYNPQTNTWRRLPDVPVPMNHTNAEVVDGKIYVVGFLDDRFTGTGRVFAFDPGTGGWSEREPMPAGTERGASGTAVLGGKIYVLGGSRGGSVSDASVYDPVLDDWSALPPLPTARDHLCAGAIDGTVYAASGRNGPNLAVLEALAPGAGGWSARAPIPTARGGIACGVYQGRLYVLGGEGNPAAPTGVFAAVEAYDPALNQWQAFQPMQTPRHGIGAAVLGNRIYVPGGATREGFEAVATNEAFEPPDAGAKVPALALPWL